MIAINQDVTPQGRPIKSGDLTVWARHLSDGSVAVALYNQEDSATKIGFQFADLGSGWTSSSTATIRDLWQHKDLGTFTGGFPAVAVRAHQTVVLRVTPPSSA